MVTKPPRDRAAAVGGRPTTPPTDTIRSPRLDLVPLPAAALEALLRGDDDAASGLVGVALVPALGARSATLLRARLDDLRASPEVAPWLLRVIVLRDEAGLGVGRRPAMVGLAGFHGRPDITGTVEIGYEVEPDRRGRGYATETASALVTWALTDGGARRVIAAVRPDNAPSLAVVARLGFVPVGSRWDAIEGRAQLFERRTPPAGPEWQDAAERPERRPRQRPVPAPGAEAHAMTDPTGERDIYPDRDPAETRHIAARLGAIFRGHRADPADPGHRCLCGWDGESFEDHLATATLREMKEVGYEVWPARHA